MGRGYGYEYMGAAEFEWGAQRLARRHLSTTLKVGDLVHGKTVIPAGTRIEGWNSVVLTADIPLWWCAGRIAVDSNGQPIELANSMDEVLLGIVTNKLRGKENPRAPQVLGIVPSSLELCGWLNLSSDAFATELKRNTQIFAAFRDFEVYTKFCKDIADL